MEKRRFLQHSTFLIVSKIVNSLTVFFTGVLLTRSLSKADYGTFSQFVLLSTVISLILGAWLAKSIYYFIPTSPQKKQIVLQTNLVLFGLGLIVGLLIWLLRYQIAHWFGNAALASLAIYISLYVLMLTIHILSEPFFISVDKAHILALTNVVFSIVYVSVLGYALLKGVSLSQLMTIIVLLYLGLVLFVLANMLKLPGAGGGGLSVGFLSRQFQYAAPLFLSSFTVALGSQVDKFIIATFYPTVDFAVYYRGAIELPVLAIVTYTISGMLLPKLVQLYKAHRKEDFLRVWHEAIKKTAILIFPLFVIFLFISQRFITFLYTERYAGSTPIFRIYLLVLIIQVTSYDCILQATGKTRVIFYAAALNAITNVTASLILIRIVGLPGAAIGLVLGQAIATLYYLTRIRRIFRVSFAEVFPWFHVLRVFLLAVCLGAFTYAISYLRVFTSQVAFMCIYSFVFMVFYTVFIFKLKFLRLEDLEFLKLSFLSRTR
jgi:O-antigen/teichoic acid export membrane protein